MINIPKEVLTEYLTERFGPEKAKRIISRATDEEILKASQTYTAMEKLVKKYS